MNPNINIEGAEVIVKAKVGDLIRYKQFSSTACGLVIADDTPTAGLASGFLSLRVQWANGIVCTYGSNSLEYIEVINNAS